MADVHAMSGEGFGLIVLAAAAAVILIYPLLQQIARMFGIVI
jgi:hypothetical protein